MEYNFRDDFDVVEFVKEFRRDFKDFSDKLDRLASDIKKLNSIMEGKTDDGK